MNYHVLVACYKCNREFNAEDGGHCLTRILPPEAPYTPNQYYCNSCWDQSLAYGEATVEK